MGLNTTWKIEISNPEWLDKVLREGPNFRKFNEPYYEFKSSTSTGDHPDAIASLTPSGLEFTDFGDPQVIGDLWEYLQPLVGSVKKITS